MEKPKALRVDVGLIRMVVRRGAPSNQRMGIRRPPLSRVRSVRIAFDMTDWRGLIAPVRVDGWVRRFGVGI